MKKHYYLLLTLFWAGLAYSDPTPIKPILCHVKIVNPANGNTEVPLNKTLSVYYTSPKQKNCLSFYLYESDTHHHVHTHILKHKEWPLSVLSIYLGAIKIKPTHIMKPHHSYYLVLDHQIISRFTTEGERVHQKTIQKKQRTLGHFPI